MPETLDLSEHARLAINGVLGSCDPQCSYENYFLTIFDVHPAYMLHYGSQVSGVLPKYVEALPLLRLMSGSTQDTDIEEAMLDAILADTAEDGLLYDRASPKRPWNAGSGYGLADRDEDYANLAGNGRLLAGFLYYHQLSGESTWKEHAQRTAERMLELALRVDDYAYYPNPGVGNDFSYPRLSGWTHTRPPTSEFEGAEASTSFYLLQPVRGFTRWYYESGDDRFLDLSRGLVNFCLRREFWGGLNDVEPSAGAEHAHFFGHFHGRLAALRGMLDYAIAADDYRVKEFVRDGYEWARHHGIHRLGVFPGRDSKTEGCTVADMVGLAVQLTDAGIGDYWEDVDQYTRNGLIAIQATDKDEMTRVSEAGPERKPESPWGGYGDQRFAGYGGVLPNQETVDRVLDRAVGQFGHLDGARYLLPMLMHCCTANGAQALYYAWEAITRRTGNSGEVNLWLNRRSPWLDIVSWLPDVGRVSIQNKGLERVAIRIPAWARADAVRCSVEGRVIRPDRIGNRLILSGLNGSESIVIEAPLKTEKASYTLGNLNHRVWGFGHAKADEYNCEFRGNSALSVEIAAGAPGGQHRDWYRIFTPKDPHTNGGAPTKEEPGYVHDRVVTW
jgi:hypothetical protein